MAFEIFELSGASIIAKHSLKLAGHNFIYNAWKNLGEPTDGWVAQSAFISKELKAIVATNNELKIIISTMNYEFFVDEIWGWTYKKGTTVEWTPLLFVGTEVTQDTQNNTVNIHQKHLYQFMYLQGESNGWVFGAGGPNTSPLLFDNTFDWFRRAIK